MLKSDLQDIKQNKCSTQQHSRLNIFIMRKYVLKSDLQDNKPNKCSTLQHKKGVKVCVRMCTCMFFGHCVLERRRCECNIFDSTGILQCYGLSLSLTAMCISLQCVLKRRCALVSYSIRALYASVGATDILLSLLSLKTVTIFHRKLTSYKQSETR